MGNAARPESPEHDEPTSLRNFEEPLSPLIESLSPIQKRKYNPRASRNSRKRSKQTSIENPALDSTDPTLTINRTQPPSAENPPLNDPYYPPHASQTAYSPHYPQRQANETIDCQHETSSTNDLTPNTEPWGFNSPRPPRTGMMEEVTRRRERGRGLEG